MNAMTMNIRKFVLIILFIPGGMTVAESPADETPKNEGLWNIRSSFRDREKSYRHSARVLIRLYHGQERMLHELQKQIGERKVEELTEKDVLDFNSHVGFLKSYRNELSVITDPQKTKAKEPPTAEELQQIEVILKTPIPEKIPLPGSKEKKSPE